ncbi:MAG: hypothetical protein ACJ746_10940 [Bryobacteraceae bacterium]
MKLVNFSKVSTLLLLACSAVGFGSNVLSAQISRGNFTLPVETHWGSVVMAPGAYSYTLDRASSGFVISVSPEGKLSKITIPTTGGVSTAEPSERSTLLLVTKGGETTVRSMHFGHAGVTLHYRSSNASAHLVAKGLERYVTTSAGG